MEIKSFGTPYGHHMWATNVPGYRLVRLSAPAANDAFFIVGPGRP